MKRNFKFYALIWAVLLAVWCVIVFVVRPLISGYAFNYDARFWISFVFVLAAFIGNLVCAYLAFKADNLKKMFLNLPLITVSRSALIAMLVVSSVFMLIPDCPAWIAAVCSVVILMFNAIAVIKAGWAAEAVNEIDERIAVQTSFIRNLTVDAESILSRAKSDAVRAECKKVYEAVRYSDPMSAEALSVIEAEMAVKAEEFYAAVGADDAEKAKEIADEIVVLAAERNKKCKLLK